MALGKGGEILALRAAAEVALMCPAMVLALTMVDQSEIATCPAMAMAMAMAMKRVPHSREVTLTGQVRESANLERYFGISAFLTASSSCKCACSHSEHNDYYTVTPTAGHLAYCSKTPSC